jgi:YVTN family beta-propeller protein
VKPCARGRAGSVGVRRGAIAMLAGVGATLLLCPASARADEAFITEQSADEVSVLDLATREVVARIKIDGKPAGIAMARDGKTAFVTSPEGKYVSVIDAAARKVLRRIPMPDTPLGIAVDPAGAFICVAGFYQPRLYKIDPATGSIVATVTVGASPCPTRRSGSRSIRRAHLFASPDSISRASIRSIPRPARSSRR